MSSCCASSNALNSSVRGMQQSRDAAAAAAQRIATPQSQGPELRNRDSLRDVLDISQASRGMQASAVVFSVAADMSDIALSIGARLDRFA
ncbi:MAG: hypothetical protein R3F46_00575 [bacterium]